MDAVIEHLHLLGGGVCVVVEVDVHGEGHGLAALFLAVYAYAGVEAHTVEPRAYVAASLKLGEAAPQVDEYLLKEVVHLVIVFGEHVAHGVYRGLVLPHELGELPVDVALCGWLMFCFHCVCRLLSCLRRVRCFFVFLTVRRGYCAVCYTAVAFFYMKCSLISPN